METGISDTVEIFGCETGPHTGTVTGTYSKLVYLPGGTYIDESNDDDDNGYVMACGGFTCEVLEEGQPPSCGFGQSCYEWRPEVNVFVNQSSMITPKFAFLLTESETGFSGGSKVPLAVGYRQMSETYDYDTKTWSQYQETDNLWFSYNCLIHASDGYIYFVQTKVQRLDPVTWTIQDLADVPMNLLDPGRCVATTIDGKLGIFLMQGYFFNLVDMKWELKKEAPYNPITGPPRALFEFRGLPAVFGHPVCGADGECYEKDVIQYDPDSNDWIRIGEMAEARSFHEVVKVPGEVCDHFVEAQVG